MDWEEKADIMDLVLSRETDMNKIMAKLPSLFGVSPKASYLAYRAMGLDSREALEIVGLDDLDLAFWRESDSRFLEFEYDKLIDLQEVIGPELIRLGFMRNMAMFVSKDAQILKKSGDLLSLNKREFDYLMKIRSHYTPNDLVAIERAMGRQEESKVTIQLNWGPHQQHLIEGAVEGEFKLLGEGNDEE